MTNRKIGFLVVSMLSVALILSGLACAGGEEEGAAVTEATETAAPITKPKVESAESPVGWADIPIYPGAKSVQEWQMQLPGATAGEEFTKVEWRHYSTKDAVATVADFYQDEMPSKGWNKIMWMTAAEGMAFGTYEKSEGDIGVGIWIMREEKEELTQIAIWRGEEKK